MKNKICITIVSIIIILLQVTVLEYLKISDISPNLILIFMLLLSIIGGKSDLYYGGVLCGILQDMTLSKTIGVHLMINLIFCSILYRIKKSSSDDGFVSFLAMSFIACLVYDSISFFICAFPKSIKEIVFVYRNFIFVGAIYNTVCLCVLYIILKIRDGMGENYVRKAKR